MRLLRFRHDHGRHRPAQQNPQPSDDDIAAPGVHLCCGAYPHHHPRHPSLPNSPSKPPRRCSRDPESLSSSLRLTPDLDRWIRIDPGGTVTVFTGKVEIGQGIQTVIAQIAAEELDVSMQRSAGDPGRYAARRTKASPQAACRPRSAGAVRLAAAEARHILVGLPPRNQTPMDRLRAEDGTVYDSETGAKSPIGN